MLKRNFPIRAWVNIRGKKLFFKKIPRSRERGIFLESKNGGILFNSIFKKGGEKIV